MKKAIFILAILSFSLQTFAQNGTIKGQVIDQQSEIPLIGATVVVVDTDPVIGAVTDLDGYFSLKNVPLGRVAVSVSYLGYEPLTLPNVEVVAGKETNLDITLTEGISLNEIVVTSDATGKDQAINEMSLVSARQFSVEEVNRYSGGRMDVARLASNFAGVSTPDDQRNDIVIRGNSPTGVLWRLEGTPIPSPNHFSTLGTTGGPVSALNPNILKNSDFVTSAFPAEYGNAIAGVFDLGFRKGNRDKHALTSSRGVIRSSACSIRPSISEPMPRPITKTLPSILILVNRNWDVSASLEWVV